MYAIIRAGGKQAKVQPGDVIDIERVKSDDEELTFAPLLVVDDKGESHSDREELAKATVTAKVLGETAGEKVDIFKYKNKTGYRRRMGHRQKYTQVEITAISLPGAKATTAKKADAEDEAAAEKPAAKKPAAKKPAAKKPAAKKADTKSTDEKTDTKKPAAKKPTARKPAAKKPAAKKPASKSSEKE
jgi:large subunit ribosomal protein L21